MAYIDSDGNLVLTGPELTPNPSVIDYGDVQTGVAADVDVLFINTGDSDLVITALSSDNAILTFPGVPAWPQTVTPGTSLSVTFRCIPAGAGAASAVATVTSNGVNFPVQISCSVNGVAAGTIALTVDPPEWTFDNQKVGTTSSEKLFVVTNSSSVNITVNAPTFPTDFNAGPTVPAYPVLLASGVSLTFGVRFAPLAEGYVTQDVQVNSTAPTSPFLLACKGQAYLITSAYVVPVTAVAQQLWAFAEDSTVTVQKNAVPFSYDCDVNALVQKLHNMGLIGTDKTTAFFWLHYEDLGVVEVDVTISNQVTGASASFTRTLGSVLANERVLLDIFEVNVEGENLLLTIERAADAGALSIIDYGIKYLPSEEVLGTFANPKTITPAYVYEGDELLLLAFGDLSVKQMPDPEDFDTEEDATVSNSHLLPFQTEAGSVPGFTYEKQVCRVFFHYEDWGVAEVQVTATTMRGQTSSQSVSIGSATADGAVNNGIADLLVVDEVVKITFSHVSGNVVIVDYTAKYEMKGERGK